MIKVGEHTWVDSSLLLWFAYLLFFGLIISPWAYWFFRPRENNTSRKDFFPWYWSIVKKSFSWFKLSNILAICLTALWVGVAHRELGEAIGHYIPVLALLHIIFSTFEHHLRIFTETPSNIAKTIREEIEKSIKNQRVYVSGLQSAGLEGILDVIRHKDTLADSQHGFALIRFNSEVLHYAKVCEECLEQAEKSVKSMSDFDFDEGLLEFQDGWPAETWTRKVNEKVKSKPLHVHRVQVMNYARFEFAKNLAQYINVTDVPQKLQLLKKLLEYARVSESNQSGDANTHFVKSLENGISNYKKNYWLNDGLFNRSLLIRSSLELGKTYKPLGDFQQHDEYACGEFILFDDNVLVRYSPSNKLLEVLIGKPVEEFTKTFNKIGSNNADWNFEHSTDTIQFFMN